MTLLPAISSHATFRAILLLAALLIQGLIGFAQPVGFEAREDANGISYDAPKVFDNRSLTLMLEAWDDELRNKQFVDATKLAAALGTLQGSRTREFISNTTIQTVGTPSSKRELTHTTDSATGKDGPSTDDNLIDKTTTERAANTPTIPTLEAPPTNPATNYSTNAVDLLADQANLTYQIFNLRMLLERSLSDRLLLSGRPRLQAVLGFNVSIRPPDIAKDAAAVFEVSVVAEGKEPDGISVVSQMAQERAYGATSLDTKSNSFGGAAVVKVVQLGYNQRSSEQNYFLYRDNDTTSYQRSGASGNETTFGWVFRPVLGRRSVNSEQRQVFAVLALPVADESSLDHAKLSIVVRTYWRSYNRHTMTSEEGPDASRWTRTKHLLTGAPLYFFPNFRFKSAPRDIFVPSTNFYQTKLRPEIQDLRWLPTGDKSALLTIEGENFFAGTHVVLGDKSYTSAADGMVIKSSRTIEILAPINALASNRGVVIGRYGESRPLQLDDLKTPLPVPGVRIDQIKVGESVSGTRVVDVWLRGRGAPDDLHATDLPPGMVLTVNGTTILPPYRFTDQLLNRVKQDGKTELAPRVAVQTTIPDALLKNGAADIQVIWPFRPEHWTDAMRRTDPDAVYAVERISDNIIMIRSTDPSGFRDRSEAKQPRFWRVRFGATNEITVRDKEPANGPTGKKISPNALWITGVGDEKKVILISPYGATFVLDVPKGEEKPRKETKTIEIAQNDSVWLELKIPSPENVATVRADSASPEFFVVPAENSEKSPSSIRVHLIRAVTQESGVLELSINYKDGKTTIVPIKIIPQDKKTKTSTS